MVRSLVAAWGRDCHDSWEAILKDQVLSRGASRETWRDDQTPLQIAVLQDDGPRNVPLAVLEPTPTFEQTQDYVVAFDGRLYGKPDGVHPVVAAYLRWGDACGDHLDGDFCFILWDRGRQRLLVGCNRAGTRPLSYFFDGETFLVASRTLSLLRHPRVPLRWNRVYLAHALTGSWSQSPGTTAFAGINRVRPGATLVLEDGRLRESAPVVTSYPADRWQGDQAIDEFWRLLQNATGCRFDGQEQTCLSLSGGLDSSLVGVALADHCADFDAFSLVSTQRPELDESQAIAAFRRVTPGLRWHSVACDEGHPERSTRGPLADDPIAVADAFRPARLEMMRQIRSHGFSSVLDGEGGDELFALSRRIGDLASAGNRSRLLSVLAHHQRPRALVWRGLIVPRLPRRVRAAWNWRERRRLTGTPTWMSGRFWNDDATREAREQTEWAHRIDSTSVALRYILEHPGNVATWSAQRVMAASVGLELRSPLLDRALVDFVLRLSPELLWSPAESKPFLRAAGRGRLPEEILRMDKHAALFQYMLNRALSSEDAEEVARLLTSNDDLVDFVQPGVALEYLRRAKLGALSDHDADALYVLIATARWMQSVTTEYG